MRRDGSPVGLPSRGRGGRCPWGSRGGVKGLGLRASLRFPQDLVQQFVIPRHPTVGGVDIRIQEAAVVAVALVPEEDVAGARPDPGYVPSSPTPRDALPAVPGLPGAPGLYQARQGFLDFPGLQSGGFLQGLHIPRMGWCFPGGHGLTDLVPPVATSAVCVSRHSPTSTFLAPKEATKLLLPSLVAPFIAPITPVGGVALLVFGPEYAGAYIPKYQVVMKGLSVSSRLVAYPPFQLPF